MKKLFFDESDTCRMIRCAVFSVVVSIILLATSAGVGNLELVEHESKYGSVEDLVTVLDVLDN